MNNQNIILDIQDSGTAPTEPVTLGEMKAFMRLEGFIDTDDSTTDSLWDFDFDDTLITNMIKAARKKAEDFCGCSFVDHEWTVVFTNGAGDFEFPYGPLTSTPTLTYKDGTAVGASAVTTYGNDFKYLDVPKAEYLQAVYDAGYEDCPEEVRLAIMQTVYYWYENREKSTLPEGALNILRMYKRAWTWLA